METIEVYYYAVPPAFYHTGLLYTDSNGNRHTVRGGPTNKDPEFKLPPNGPLITEIGPYDKSVDAYDHDGDPKTPPLPPPDREIITQGEDLSAIWKSIENTYAEIGGREDAYVVFYNDCNDATEEALNNAGLPIPERMQSLLDKLWNSPAWHIIGDTNTQDLGHTIEGDYEVALHEGTSDLYRHEYGGTRSTPASGYTLAIPEGGNRYSFDSLGNPLGSASGYVLLDNVLYGSNQHDTIRGLLGNDALDGRDGNDTLDGGDNDDLIAGGKGSDYILGGSGNDLIYSADNLDNRRQQYGPDDLWINWGQYRDLPADVMGATWATGSGWVVGAAWNDVDTAPDVIDGGPGHDSIYGSFGGDFIQGGTGICIFV
ncbi:hypothetical protein FACS1894116_12440 [Betaproteobacteria bacterium]|nr:hypothetical protein FACS1894116_12440 [Betaproteobacteria bacterium]GHU01611.1 hypothetical protein FACS1894154_11580 [Betaproteobacteria bacterium]GHU25610.1 hypothetical protein FACS189488_13010 [Betaproteobacteria bacterium]GHU33204.1 hypothetical protein FACS189497_14940 [Betaproteobacteria bacterium]